MRMLCYYNPIDADANTLKVVKLLASFADKDLERALRQPGHPENEMLLRHCRERMNGIIGMLEGLQADAS